LKLTTDRHEASCGLSATAELYLLVNREHANWFRYFKHVNNQKVISVLGHHVYRWYTVLLQTRVKRWNAVELVNTVLMGDVSAAIESVPLTTTQSAAPTPSRTRTSARST